MRVTKETCANCGETIGNLESPFVWRDQVVCAGCHRKLSPPAGAPELRGKSIPIGRVIIFVIAGALIIGGLASRYMGPSYRTQVLPLMEAVQHVAADHDAWTDVQRRHAELAEANAQLRKWRATASRTDQGKRSAVELQIAIAAYENWDVNLAIADDDIRIGGGRAQELEKTAEASRQEGEDHLQAAEKAFRDGD